MYVVIIIIKKEQLSLKMLEIEIEEDKLKLNNDKIEVFHHHPLLSAQPSNTHKTLSLQDWWVGWNHPQPWLHLQ